MNKMGMKEHIPPPRPKKRSKRPYPKSREGGRRRHRGEGDEGDEKSGSSSEGSESGSSSSSSGSDSDDGEDESESKQQQQQQREVRTKRENGQQNEEESKQHRSPVKRGARVSTAMSDVDEAMNGSSRGAKQERRKKEADRSVKRRSQSKSRKRSSGDEQNGSGSDKSSAADSSDDDNHSAVNNKANSKPTKRRRTTDTASLASLPSPASFNHTLPTLPSLPLHDLPSSSVYGPAWMESDAAIEFDQPGSAPMQQSSNASLSDEDEGVAPLPLRLHHHSHHHRSSSSSQMSHFAALSQLSPVSQLSQAADLVGEQVDDDMQLGGRVDEVVSEQGEGEVMGMYGPFPEDFVYPPAAPPPPPAPPIYGPFQPNRRSPLQPAARHMARHRTPSSATSSSSTAAGNKPEFSKVYAFLGSLFDPSTSGHTEDLEAMTPSNREMVKALMHNLARNLNSSGVAGVGGSSSELGEVSTVPSPMPLSFSPAPDVFTADSPAHRFSSSASVPSFFSTPAATHKPTTPPPSSSVGPSSALFTPSSSLPTRSTTHINTPSDFFHPAITSHTTSSLSASSSVVSTPLPPSDGEGRSTGLSGLTLNLSPSGGLSTGGLDSPGGVVLFSPLGGASVGETSIGGH